LGIGLGLRDGVRVGLGLTLWAVAAFLDWAIMPALKPALRPARLASAW